MAERHTVDVDVEGSKPSRHPMKKSGGFPPDFDLVRIAISCSVSFEARILGLVSREGRVKYR